MRADQILSERPAPVAPLPPWGVPKSVTFSMARSVTFSMAIDTWAFPEPLSGWGQSPSPAYGAAEFSTRAI